MKLPHAQEAVVPRNKIENYLLNPAHAIGGGKATFFFMFGFTRERWTLLAEALGQHARKYAVADSFADADGTTYLVEGPLQTPSGRTPRPNCLVSRNVETGKLAPRFITAYPLAE